MTERLLNTPKGVIHYWVGGTREGTPLVFLPGLTADHRLFRFQLEQFEKTNPVLVWDAPGHGASRPFTLDFTLMDKAGWLEEILYREEPFRRPVLVGQSMGGYLSQCFLQRCPGRARGFVCIDSAPLQRSCYTAAELWMLKHCETMYRCYPWEALVKAGSDGCATSAQGRALMREMLADYQSREYARLAGHGFRMLAGAVEQNLPYRLDCPTLLLCGERDQAGFTKRYNRNWEKRTGIPVLWVPGAGHNSNTDAPEFVNDAIEHFIKEKVTV